LVCSFYGSSVQLRGMSRATAAPAARRTAASALVLTPLIIAAALFVYKTNSAVAVLRSTWSSGTITGRPNVVAFGTQFPHVDVLQRSLNYFAVIWPALALGVLIAAAVRAFVPADSIARLVGRRTLIAQLRAGLAATPLMLCSCCATPLFGSVAESCGRIAPAIAVLLASPSLNPAALTLTFMLFDPRIAAARVFLAIAAVVFVGPLAERHTSLQLLRQASMEEPADVTAAMKFLRSVGIVATRTVPGVVVGVIVSMLLVQALPPSAFASAGARVLSVLIAASVAVPLALPTFLEIPLALGLLVSGFPAGAALALLFAGPAINLPSLFSIARVSGWKGAAIVAAAIWGLAVLGGLLFEVGSLV
jgi:uncharacterized protein